MGYVGLEEVRSENKALKKKIAQLKKVIISLNNRIIRETDYWFVMEGILKDFDFGNNMMSIEDIEYIATRQQYLIDKMENLKNG